MESQAFYPRRGVTLCAGQIGISLDFIKRLLKRMHELGMNELVWEFKLQSSQHPETVTWHYYTPEEVREVLRVASLFDIDVVPLVNAPGHMGIWLESHPELALQRTDGTIDPEGRLDITNPKAVDFYLSLIEEYLQIMPSKWWHMGADEYMIHDSFDNYPQILQTARLRLGSEASEYDLFNDIVNLINDYVHSQNRKLRIWNDGIHPNTQILLDSDIVVEYWKDENERLAELESCGHKLVNVSEDLYWSRSHPPYRVDARRLWDSEWTARTFIGEQIMPPPLSGEKDSMIGLRLSIWPDESFRQTENEVWEAIQDSLVLVGYLGQNGEKQGTWDSVLASFPSPSPLPEPPLAEGTYRFQGLDTLAPGPWELKWTPDCYVTLTNIESGKSLALCHGDKHLGVVTQTGALAELVSPAEMNVTWPEGWDDAEVRNTQKWALRPATDGFALSPALTGQVLARDQAGNVTQFPPDKVPRNASLVVLKEAQ